MPRVKIAPPRRPARRRTHNGLLAWPPSARAIQIAAASSAVAIVLGTSIYLWRAGVPEIVADAYQDVRASVLAATGSAGLKVQEILVEGRTETPAQHVLAVLDVKRGSPILAFDPAQARAELERLAWVRDASVERRLPDTILVRITERRALALWQHSAKLSVIDHDGNEIKDADPAKFAKLPLVVGDDAPKHAAQLLALLALEPDLEKRVAAAIRVGSRRWNLRMDAGDGITVDVHLPETNAGAAWSRLAEVERTNRVLDRNISVIDLRMPDRLIVRAVREAPPPPPPRGARNAGKPT
jgi:cell division protein FtsQ